MGELNNLIEKAQKCDRDSLLELINRFDPLIKKYSYFLGTEDSKQELTLEFIRVVKNINLNNLKIKTDAALTSYIRKSIKNKYIQLSIAQNLKENKETVFEYEKVNNSYKSNDDLIAIVNSLIDTLTDLEKEVIILRYYKEFSDIEISQFFHISRQAVNQNKNRALKKMRKEYFYDENLF